jgi:hypothetical protein
MQPVSMAGLQTHTRYSVRIMRDGSSLPEVPERKAISRASYCADLEPRTEKAYPALHSQPLEDLNKELLDARRVSWLWDFRDHSATRSSKYLSYVTIQLGGVCGSSFSSTPCLTITFPTPPSRLPSTISRTNCPPTDGSNAPRLLLASGLPPSPVARYPGETHHTLTLSSFKFLYHSLEGRNTCYHGREDG